MTISSDFATNSEAFSSSSKRNEEGMVPLYYMHSDSKYSVVLDCMNIV